MIVYSSEVLTITRSSSKEPKWYFTLFGQEPSLVMGRGAVLALAAALMKDAAHEDYLILHEVRP